MAVINVFSKDTMFYTEKLKILPSFKITIVGKYCKQQAKKNQYIQADTSFKSTGRNYLIS